MINPFVIYSDEEQAALQEYADREVWRLQCKALGATDEQTHAYDLDARRYAATTIYPNHVVVAYARRIAREALARGEEMPTDAEQAIRVANARALARLLESSGLFSGL